MFNIVLYEPQIPQNTGNIARTCAITGSRLHLIKPYGFIISDKNLRRAGLDYWRDVEVYEYDNFDEFLISNFNSQIFLLSSKAEKIYTEAVFNDNDFLMFGSETSGVPENIHDKYFNTRLKIPMRNIESARCLNLANSVSLVLYEALRQICFLDLK